MTDSPIITDNELVLVTGAAGFLGRSVVESLLLAGHRNVRCLVRPSGDTRALNDLARKYGAAARVQILPGNLLSDADCERAVDGVEVIYHLAVGRSDMYADAFLNSALTTRNLLRAAVKRGGLKRFVNVSSFSVYTNRDKASRLLDESSPVETEPAKRGDPYTFAKTKQDEIVAEYSRLYGVPYVIVRPGVVYGPGSMSMTNRVGIDTFGFFLHLGGFNRIPLTYVDNCADAIVLAGVRPGVEGEVFNVVDDDLPRSWRLLRLYKKNVRRFPSIYVPHLASYVLCRMWEWYSRHSEGQLPPAFNTRCWHAFWKRTQYSNAKVKVRLGWTPRIPSREGLSRYFDYCRERANG
ncbi:MAG TPA: NAD(P)-dependent oxidoreductase [Vicinamibacterales bacterium]